MRSAVHDAHGALATGEPVVVSARRIFRHVKAHFGGHFRRPAFAVHLHLRLNLRRHFVEQRDHVFRRQHAVKQLGVTLEELFAVLRHLHQLTHKQVRFDLLVADAFFVHVIADAANGVFNAFAFAGGVEQTPVHIEHQIAPLAVAGFCVAVEADVAWVGVAIERLEDVVIKHVVDVETRFDFGQQIGIAVQIGVFDLVVKRLVIRVGALLDLRGGETVGLQYVDIVRIGPAFVLGDHIHARAFAHVVMAIVFAVDVDDNGLPRLRDKRAVRLVNQARFQTVQHAGVQAVLTAVAQNEALVGRERAVVEQGIVKFALAELAVRLDIQALLRHIQRILAHHAEADALRDLKLSVFVSVFHPAAEPVLLAERGFFEPRPVVCFGVNVRAVGERAIFLVGQIVRIGRQADDRHRVVHRNQIRFGDNLRGFHAVAIGARADDRIGFHLDRPGVDGGGFVRVSAVERIAHGAVRRNVDRHRVFARQRPLVQAARDVEGRRFGIADEALPVRFARRGGGVIEKARLTERAPVRGVVVKLGHDHLVQNLPAGGRETDGLARFFQVEIGEIINAVFARLRGVAVDDQIAVVFNGDVRKLPFARFLNVIGQAVTLEVYGLPAHVVNFNVIVVVIDVRPVCAFVAGHDFGDVQSRCVGQTHRGIHRRHARARVGQPRRGAGKDLETAVALFVAAPGGIRGEQVIGHHVDHSTLNVRKNDGFAVGAQFKTGVRPASLRCGAILLGGKDDEIAVRLDDASLRKTPLDELVRAVAQRVVGKIDGLIGCVMDLDPVGIVAVFVLERGDGGRADLVDHQRAALQHRARTERRVAFLGVVVSRRVLIGDDVIVAANPCVAHVVIHRGHVQLLESDAVAAEEEELVACGGEFEFGVQRLSGFVLRAVGSEDDDVFARRERQIREDESDFVRTVGKAVALDVDGAVARVGDFHPIRERARLIRERAAVGGHRLRDAQICVAAGNGSLVNLRAGDVGGGGLRNFRREENHRHDKHAQRNQQRQRASLGLDAFDGAAFSARRTGILHPVGTHE